MDEKKSLVISSKMFLRTNSNITKRNNVKILDTLQLSKTPLFLNGPVRSLWNENLSGPVRSGLFVN